MKDIIVSVICTVYNHEKFLERCLNGFVIQQTNFGFEVIVHDDASNDNSPKIIKKYAQKYSEIIRPIFQKENQFSTGKDIVQDIILPQCKGKYVAFCEGDDYWTDAQKLQRQVDAIENIQGCVMCVHNTISHDLVTQKERPFFYSHTVDFMTEKEVFMEWSVHTSSYLMKKEIAQKPRFARKYWFGDYVYLTIAYDKGKIVRLPNTMSVYNFNNENGVTAKVRDLDNNSGSIKRRERIDYLKEYDEYTLHRHECIVNKRINQIDFDELLRHTKNTESIDKDFLIYISNAKTIRRHIYYKTWKKENGLIRYIYRSIRYQGYKFGYLWLIYIKVGERLGI